MRYNLGKYGTARQATDDNIVRGGADKSLARPGKKQAIANKLGIYSTYSTRSSIHFLARYSNFCKPLKKNQNVVRPTRSPRQQWPPCRKKHGDLSIGFSVQGIGGSVWNVSLPTVCFLTNTQVK